MKLTNERLTVECFPEHGFVIGAIRPHSTQRNILWNPRGASFEALPVGDLGEPGAASIESFDRGILAGGWFVMFPTAGLPGESGNHWMHGEAPRLLWEVISATDVAVVCRLTTPVSGFELVRSVMLTDATVEVTTTATNLSGEIRHVTFGEHPCFSREQFAGGTIRANPLRARTTSTADPSNSNLVESTPFHWPSAPALGGNDFDLSEVPLRADGRHDHVGLEGIDECELRGEATSVFLKWDRLAMPNALIWQHFTPVGSPWGGDVFAVEPSSAPGRSLTDAQDSAAVTLVGAGESVSTWMTLRVETTS